MALLVQVQQFNRMSIMIMLFNRNDENQSSESYEPNESNEEESKSGQKLVGHIREAPESQYLCDENQIVDK